MKLHKLAMLLLAIGTVQASEVEPQAATAGICTTDPAYRAFDFWLGEWEIHAPDGRYGGTNRIVKEEGAAFTSSIRAATSWPSGRSRHNAFFLIDGRQREKDRA